MTDAPLPSPPLSGRRREAAINDGRILEAAREVFVADPDAPISEVARRAGVGISALYSRYEGKDDLLRQLCTDGLMRLSRIVDEALADERDDWTVFSEFMRHAVESETSSLTLALAGKFTPTEEMGTLATRTNDKIQLLFDRIKHTLRPGVEVLDLSPIWEQLAAIKVGDRPRTGELRIRYLTIALDGLRAQNRHELPGSPPGWEEISGRWWPRS
jgi:AcrR family transcriptional regulator